MAESPLSRRGFLHNIAGAAALSSLARVRSTVKLPSKIRFGYASITWNGKDLLAIDEIAAVGYPGIQLRSNILAQFGKMPRAIRDLLAERKLTFVALSSGAVQLDPARQREIVDEHMSHAAWLRDAGGLYLQITDERPRSRPVSPDDCVRLGKLLTEIGTRTSEIGIPVAYHPHMGTIGERPENSDRVLAAADPRYVKLLLDVAHYQQGGGDPVAAIRKHSDRLLFLHLKDVEAVVRPASAPGAGYRFVELGRGHVDIKGVLDALVDVGFDGWGVVELDDVPDPSRSPAECARISRRYLERLGVWS